MAGRTGRCLCGAITYELAETPTAYGACHCAMCRRWTGGIELGLQVPPGGIAFDGEAPATYASSDWAERGFCTTCGSSLFWRLTADGPMKGLLSVSMGSLDDAEGMVFDTEVYVDHAPASHGFADPGTRRRLTGAELQELMNGGGD